MQKEEVEQELIIAQLEDPYTVVFSHKTLTQIAKQYKITISQLQKLNPTISNNLSTDTEVKIPSVNVFEHNYIVCKDFCANQILNCIIKYLLKKTFPRSERVSYVKSFKNSVADQFDLLQDRIQLVEHYIAENIINQDCINKIIKTI